MTVTYRVHDYLATLRRIPDEVILNMATRPFKMDVGWGSAYDDRTHTFQPCGCVVGWALRLMDEDVKFMPHFDIIISAVDLFGGWYEEWASLYFGVIGRTEVPGQKEYAGRLKSIERAFAMRVEEAVDADA